MQEWYTVTFLYVNSQRSLHFLFKFKFAIQLKKLTLYCLGILLLAFATNVQWIQMSFSLIYLHLLSFVYWPMLVNSIKGVSHLEVGRIFNYI